MNLNKVETKIKPYKLMTSAYIFDLGKKSWQINIKKLKSPLREGFKKNIREFSRGPKIGYRVVIIWTRLRLKPKNPNPEQRLPFQNYHWHGLSDIRAASELRWPIIHYYALNWIELGFWGSPDK